MSKNKRAVVAAREPARQPVKSSSSHCVRMRLPAGKYAVQAAEAEVIVDGGRIAGGNKNFEFELETETWVEVRVIRD